MNTRFSPSTGNFYPVDVDYGDQLPADVIEVSMEDYEAAMSRPADTAFEFVEGKLVITQIPLPSTNVRMTTRFSPTTGNFYPEEFDYGDKLPADVITVSMQDYEAAMARPVGTSFNFVNGALVITVNPPPSTQSIWQLIKNERDRRAEQGGYKVGVKWFHSDQKSRSQQLGLVLLGPNIPANLKWKTMDGTFVDMTPTLAGQVLAAGAASDQAIFAVAEAHKAAMEASANPSAYDFSGGWPKGFGE